MVSLQAKIGAAALNILSVFEERLKGGAPLVLGWLRAQRYHQSLQHEDMLRYLPMYRVQARFMVLLGGRKGAADLTFEQIR